MMALEVKSGDNAIRFCEGKSFGAERSVAGELVFQTGMVGYPESITDPSYRGQILVVTFPLVGNYGVPSRETRDPILPDLPAHFEASEIHIAGLVVASYCGEDYSHYLAESSLGTWLKEQNVPVQALFNNDIVVKHKVGLAVRIILVVIIVVVITDQPRIGVNRVRAEVQRRVWHVLIAI